ncbi:MAG TPA: hypothetical protein VLT59_11355 [Steroidobacteraceae bacterium]|nr:hypothetical protein [Steroidobacteraceae bacterium]
MTATESRALRPLADTAGASWEKRGNTVWVECPACRCRYPVSPRMLAAGAPPSHCPGCHHEFDLAGTVASR